jgi:carboxylesterase
MTDYSYCEDGGRIGFLLIHGLGGTPAQFRYISRELAKAGFTVSCPQLSGHCGTSEEFRVSRWQDWYESVEKALVALRKRCDTVIVAGHSMGSLLSLHLAAQNPKDVDGLALLAPAFDLDGWGVPFKQKLFRLVTQKWCADLFDFSERDTFGLKDERVRAIVVRAHANGGSSAELGQRYFYGGVFMEWRWLAKTVKRELGAISHPTLLIHPRDDDRASFRTNALAVQIGLAGRVETLTLDDSYHGLIVDKQRDLVAQRMIDFGHSSVNWTARDVAQPAANAKPGAGLSSQRR